MATTGAQLEVPHVVNTSGATVGQGNAPEAWILYSTDDASEPTPDWADATAKVYSFSSSRGRESELQDVDAGTASVTLDNRARTFDPVHNSAIRPMNRWWIREQFTGETQDIFRGYADSYDQQWPSPVGDAITVVSITDEFKVSALDKMPSTDPPRDSYPDLIMADEPTAYWRMDDDPQTLQAVSVIGPPLTAIVTPP